jgi:hypothetical protein
MGGLTIDQERLEGTEEQPLGIADAGRTLARLAHRPTDLLQDEIAAGNLGAAQQCALELCDQQSARLRRKLPKKLPQSLDGLPIHGHPAHHTGFQWQQGLPDSSWALKNWLPKASVISTGWRR